MTDLADFDAGVKEDNLSERERGLKDLSQWLLRTSDIQVCSRNAQNYTNGTFSTDSNYRPDLIVCGDKNSYLVKFTLGDNGSNVHTTLIRVLEYWRGLASGTHSYTVDGSKVSIDAVLIATNYSQFGHLFHNRQNNDPLRTGRSDGARTGASNGYLPEIEHSCSESALRLIYRIAKEDEFDTDVGIGGLYSSRLDSNPSVSENTEHSKNTTDYTPAALYFIPGEEKPQNWDYIPFYDQDSS
jgi:hypothetical protein